MKLSFDKDSSGVYRVDTGFKNVSIGTVAREANRINYDRELPAVREDEKNLVNSVTGADINNIIFLNQVHEETVISINSYPDTDKVTSGDADGSITKLENICLIIRTADCVPVFAYDPENKIIGAAHSGWRSTRLSISSKLVKIMNRDYGSDLNKISVYILPSIGPESYEVNEDVAGFFPGHSAVKDGRILLNLWSSIESSLVDAGIKIDNIFNSSVCSLLNSDKFFSHRNRDTGRNLNFALISN